MFILCQDFRTSLYCSIIRFLSSKINMTTSFLRLGSGKKLMLECWVRIRIQRHKIHRNWLLWFAGTSTIFGEFLRYSSLCSPFPTAKYWIQRTKKKPFLCISRRWIKTCGRDWGKNTGFLKDIFQCKNSQKTMFFEVRKKSEDDGRILTLNPDSATQNPYDMTTLVRRTTYFFFVGPCNFSWKFHILYRKILYIFQNSVP